MRSVGAVIVVQAVTQNPRQLQTLFLMVSTENLIDPFLMSVWL